MAPRVVDKAARQQEVALIALELFAKKGFDATSIREIAQAAGIAKGTVYEYFTSKEQIVLVAMETFMMGFEAHLAPLLDPSRDPVETLQELVRASMGAYMADPTLSVLIAAGMQVLQRSELDGNAEAVERLRVLIARWQSSFGDVLRRGAASGAFLPEVGEQADAIALDLMIYMDGLGMYSLILGDRLDVMAQSQAWMDRLMVSLRA